MNFDKLRLNHYLTFLKKIRTLLYISLIKNLAYCLRAKNTFLFGPESQH
jgi:hypothetical protein